jgi:hypothetical protein
MMLNLSFDIIGFCKTQGSIDIDDAKIRPTKSYPIIYLHEYAQFKYIWDLFRTKWVRGNERGKDDMNFDGRWRGEITVLELCLWQERV